MARDGGGALFQNCIYGGGGIAPAPRRQRRPDRLDYERPPVLGDHFDGRIGPQDPVDPRQP
jgi:hypothetical protein